jgi:hypothetical protein
MTRRQGNQSGTRDFDQQRRNAKHFVLRIVVQNILIEFVEMLIKAVGNQKILYLKQPNTKSFAFATQTSKIFSIRVRAPTRTLKSLTAMLRDRPLFGHNCLSLYKSNPLHFGHPPMSATSLNTYYSTSNHNNFSILQLLYVIK